MNETLEDWGRKAMVEGGIPSSAAAEAKIAEVAGILRSQMPGVDDASIIQQAGPQLKQAIAQKAASRGQGAAPAPMQPQAPAQIPSAGGLDVNAYKAKASQLQSDFSPEKEQVVRDQVKQRSLGTEVGRNLGAGFRVGATAQANKVLDDQYASDTAQNAAPLTAWAAKKAAAVAEIEQMVKTGNIEAQGIRDHMNRIALEQQLDERRDKATIRQTEADPTSVTSEGMRQLAKQYSPDFVSRMGDRFNSLSAAQLKDTLPRLEKEYMKQLDLAEKAAGRADKVTENDAKRVATTADQEFRAGESAKDRAARSADNNARIGAANARAAAKGGPAAVKPGDVLRAQRDDAKLGKEQRGIEDKVEAGQETLKLFDRVSGLVQGGLKTGPIVGSDRNPIGAAYKFMSGDRQEAAQIGAQLAATMAKTFGAAPSDAETRLILQANTVIEQDNPAQSLAELRAKFERQIQRNQADAEEVKTLRADTLGTVGRTPARPAAAPVVSSQAQYDALPKGSTYTDASGKPHRKN